MYQALRADQQRRNDMRPLSRRLAGLAAILGVAAILNIATSSAAPAGPPPAGKSIVWQTDFNKAIVQAKRQSKMLLIDFYTEG
jgi:hypothetical protein